MKTLCIIQARMRSVRLPGKVLKKVRGVPLLEYEIRRLRQATKIDKIVLATGEDKANDGIAKLGLRLGIAVFRGSEEDVLDRYYQCAKKYPRYANVLRVTGDCPLIDPKVIDEVIVWHELKGADYTANVLVETYPDGLDVELFKREALAEGWKKARLKSEREHVTPYIRKQRRFKKANLRAPHDFSHFRLVVDNTEDFEVISFLIRNSRPDSGYLDYISLLTKNPAIWVKNAKIKRNEGLLASLKYDQKIQKKQ